MTNQVRPYEPLTSENAVLILVDHQIGLMTGVRDYSTGELKHNVVALAKAARALKLPIVATTTARDSMWGPTFPELVEALPGIETSTMRNRALPCIMRAYASAACSRGAVSIIGRMFSRTLKARVSSCSIAVPARLP